MHRKVYAPRSQQNSHTIVWTIDRLGDSRCQLMGGMGTQVTVSPGADVVEKLGYGTDAD
jgi:hypothetical protein